MLSSLLRAGQPPMNPIAKLAELFEQFPGIGPRQSKRFVYFLLTRDTRYLAELSRLIGDIKRESSLCVSCFRFFPSRNAEERTCALCADQNRDRSMLLVVEKDIDLDNIERSGTFSGSYFVLGGRISILEKAPFEKIRGNELRSRIEQDSATHTLKEVILALSLTREGEYTMELVAHMLRPLIIPHNITLSSLGRGLSTGIELEYSDTETLRNALKTRQ